jgi:ubiquinone/menaquinone biosynthesis C-methylase UbiE
MSNMSFRGMALWLRWRERRGDLRQQLVDAGLDQGQVVLDYGCGIGSYTLPAARIVGESGMVYALDIHPLAIQTVEKRAGEEQIPNIRTIHSGKDTGLADDSVDVILLYDVIHGIQNKQALLQELHRVLRPDGHLSVIPDHMSRGELLEIMTQPNLFCLQGQHGEVLAFTKDGSA